MAVPYSKIYKRKNIESKMDLESKRQRLLKYETADTLMVNKNKKKEGDKAAPGDSVKAPERKTTVKIEKQATANKSVSNEPVKKEDKVEIEALKKIKIE